MDIQSSGRSASSSPSPTPFPPNNQQALRSVASHEVASATEAPAPRVCLRVEGLVVDVQLTGGEVVVDFPDSGATVWVRRVPPGDDYDRLPPRRAR